MGQFIHTIHEYIVLIVRYLLIITVIGFMPVPLFSFFGGDTLHEVDHNPLFQYFTHYQISTDAILENVYTNVYIDQKQKNIQQWDIDNAVLWADYLTYQLIEENIPVLRKVISTQKPGKFQSLKLLHRAALLTSPLDYPQIGQILLNLKQKFQLVLPIKSITEEARQWIIIALNTNEKNVKKQLKFLANKFPNDNFLVISQTPISLSKKTLQLQLPQFNIKQAKIILSEGLKISPIQAQILLIQHQRSIWSLNEANENQVQMSLQSLLHQNYCSLGGASKRQLKVLAEICSSGKAKVGKQLDLTDYGVIVKGKNYEWSNDEAQLSYELQANVLCGKAKWIDVQENKIIEGEIKLNQKNEKGDKITQQVAQKLSETIESDISAQKREL